MTNLMDPKTPVDTLRVLVTKIDTNEAPFRVYGEMVDDNDYCPTISFQLPVELTDTSCITIGSTFTVQASKGDDGETVFGDINFIDWHEWVGLQPKG